MKNVKYNFMKNTRSGFTLLEILLVVAAIGILAGIVIFAINPAKQLADTRNAQRRVDVNTILNAVQQFKIDNRGNLPDARSGNAISANEFYICTTPFSVQGTCEGMVDLADLTTDAKYLVAIPVDPSTDAGGGSTGYLISVAEESGRITVYAPNTENNEAVISVTN